MVKVKWWGHACFEVSDGKTVVFDPHNGTGIGLEPPQVKADLVLISHDHFDHADGANLVLRPGGIVAKDSGVRTVGEVRVRGVRTYHDEKGGKLRGENTLYVVEMGGLRICHLGDLGHVPTDRQVKEIGGVDLLFVPVGGVYTIDARGATETLEKISPRIAVPMHYRIPGLKVGIHGVEEFLKGKKNVRQVKSSQFEIKPENLPAQSEIWVLSWP
ncbi:MAG: MBL fold metallo-hydrolase [Candidatus Hadarchaeum sp.]|uniref:MBL fold metallo-hydrolase n=1 Tax=Candidatus Hadarchaeum sp. TaxID=2883567 RepID=UPI003D0BB855